MNHRNGYLLLGAGLASLLAACADDGTPLGPERVRVPSRVIPPGQASAGRFYMEVRPKEGRMEVFRLHEGDLIYRGAPMATSAVFDFSGTASDTTCDLTGTDPDTPDCGSLSNIVHLFTDQADVTYVESNGTCWRNGTQLTNDRSCGGLYTDVNHVCRGDRMFCGPLRLVSFYTFGGSFGALPNVLLDVGEVIPDTIDTCREAAADNLGFCARGSAGNQAKIAPATSTFTPAIPAAGGANDVACTLCYGNDDLVTAANRLGLRNAVISGTDATNMARNTVTAALKVNDTADDDAGFDVVLDVVYAVPSVETSGSQLTLVSANGNPLTCYTPNSQGNANTRTTVKVSGASFGPPAACLATTPGTGCNLTGSAPDSRYTVRFDGHSSNTTPTSWADGLAQTGIVADGVYGCGVTVNTPTGNVTTTDELSVCSNTWRTYNPAATDTTWARFGAASGVVADDVLTVGGALPNTSTAADTVVRLPLPRCGASTPEPTDVTASAPLPATLGRIYPGFASDGNSLYVSHGLIANGNCAGGTMHRLDWNGSSGTWTTLASSGANDCRYYPASMRIRDSVTGDDMIVIWGGLDGNDDDLTTALAYNIDDDVWLLYNLASVPAAQGIATGTSDGTNGLFMSDNGNIFSITMANTTITLTSRPTFVLQGSIFPIFTFANGRFWAINPNNRSTRSLELGVDAAWTNHGASPSASHTEGVMVASTFDEPTFGDKIRFLVMGGFEAAGGIVEEYNISSP